MGIAVGLTTAADARAAAAETALLAREPLIAAPPTLAVLVTSPHHAPDARGVLQVVREFAQPNALVGCVAEAMVAGRREVEGEPAGWCASAACRSPASSRQASSARSAARTTYFDLKSRPHGE